MIGLFVVLGVLQRVSYPYWSFANLDSEVSVATWFSATLLWAAAIWWMFVAVSHRPTSVALWVWWPVLAWLAFDEGTAVHEKLERWSGIDWQIIYLPVMILGAAAWVGVVRTFRQQKRVVALLVTTAAVWTVALTFELVQNWGGSPVQAGIYVPTMIAEEALEMIGSVALIVAAVLALRLSIENRPPSIDDPERSDVVG